MCDREREKQETDEGEAVGCSSPSPHNLYSHSTPGYLYKSESSYAVLFCIVRSSPNPASSASAFRDALHDSHQHSYLLNRHLRYKHLPLLLLTSPSCHPLLFSFNFCPSLTLVSSFPSLIVPLFLFIPLLLSSLSFIKESNGPPCPEYREMREITVH